jgi:mRNA interferase MazF
VLRGEIWWASLPAPVGSSPGYRRPVLIVQSDEFNRSAIRTALVAVITSNTRLADAPGNVLLPESASGLPKDSTVNVSQVLTIDRSLLTEIAGMVESERMDEVDSGLRLVMSL